MSNVYNSQWKSHPSIFEPDIQNSICSEAAPIAKAANLQSCCDIFNIQDSAFQKP